ncbi:MAG: hypothetical protein PVI57_23555 [Gemmatimonadota bacterium]|jgi:hypothetical protein
MIISHRYRFIFIKTMKTAGTSIEVYLSRRCGPEDVFTPIRPAVEGHVARNHRGFFNPLGEMLGGSRADAIEALRDLRRRRKFYNHLPARVARHRVGRRVWNGYFKFCVERNPWDKTLSHFHMLNYRRGEPSSLDDYLAGDDFCLNHPYYMDPGGERPLVDRVLRYERLLDELGEIFERLGVPFSGSLEVQAKSHYRSDRRPYREVYTDEQRRAVARTFRKEIQLHGYTY